ncbi:hypothetical protein ABPG72_005875 [Tetrahymena utriculariae]
MSNNNLKNLFDEISKIGLKKFLNQHKDEVKKIQKEFNKEVKQQVSLKLKEQKKQTSLQFKEEKKLQKQQEKQQLKMQREIVKQQEKEQKKQQKLQEKEAFKKLSKEEKIKVREQKKLERELKLQQKKEKMIQAIQEKEKLKQQQKISFLEKQQKMKNNLTNEIIIDDIIDQQHKDIRGLIFDNKDLLVERLQQVFDEQGKIKIQFRCIILTEEEKIVYNQKGFDIKIIKKNHPLISDFNHKVVSNSEEQITKTLQEFYQQYDEACEKLKNSSVKVVGVKYYLIKCLRFEQEIGSFIELEKIIQNKKAQNNMNKEQQDKFILDSMNIGMAKDEQINDPISEFVAIKSLQSLTLYNKARKISFISIQ